MSKLVLLWKENSVRITGKQELSQINRKWSKNRDQSTIQALVKGISTSLGQLIGFSAPKLGSWFFNFSIE